MKDYLYFIKKILSTNRNFLLIFIFINIFITDLMSENNLLFFIEGMFLSIIIACISNKVIIESLIENKKVYELNSKFWKLIILLSLIIIFILINLEIIISNDNNMYLLVYVLLFIYFGFDKNEILFLEEPKMIYVNYCIIKTNNVVSFKLKNKRVFSYIQLFMRDNKTFKFKIKKFKNQQIQNKLKELGLKEN